MSRLFQQMANVMQKQHFTFQQDFKQATINPQFLPSKVLNKYSIEYQNKQKYHPNFHEYNSKCKDGSKLDYCRRQPQEGKTMKYPQQMNIQDSQYTLVQHQDIFLKNVRFQNQFFQNGMQQPLEIDQNINQKDSYQKCVQAKINDKIQVDYKKSYKNVKYLKNVVDKEKQKISSICQQKLQDYLNKKQFGILKKYFELIKVPKKKQKKIMFITKKQKNESKINTSIVEKKYIQNVNQNKLNQHIPIKRNSNPIIINILSNKSNILNVKSYRQQSNKKYIEISPKQTPSKKYYHVNLSKYFQ